MSLPPSKLISPYGSDRLVRLAARLRPALCDTLITVGDQEFPAHSLVLAGVSQQLGRRGQWSLAEGISSSTFAQLLSFVYGESVELQSRELGPLEEAAKVLGVQALEEACRQAQRDRAEELDHGLKNHEEEPEQPTGDPRTGKEAQKPATRTSVGRAPEMPHMPHQRKLPRESPEMPEANGEGQGQWQPKAAKEESRSQSLPGHGGADGKEAAVLLVKESSRGSEESLREFPGPLPLPGSLWAFDLPGPRWAEAPWLREGQPVLWNMLLWPPRYGTPFSHSTPSTGTWQKVWPLHQRIPLSLNAPKGLWSQNQLASSSPTPGSLPQGPAQLRPGETPESQQGHPGVPTTCLDPEGTTGHPLGQHPPLPPPAKSRPYSCPVCGKRFSLKHQMETHHRVHTGEKPFSCGLCPQRSRDFSAMAKHLRTHGAAPYRCPLCRVGCSSLASMQAHMRSHSPSQLPPGWTIRSTFLYSSSSKPPRASTSPGSPSSACL